MRKFRYSRWDGSQSEFRLDADAVLEALQGLVLEGLPPADALELLRRFGFSSLSFRVMGVDELRQELAREAQALGQQYRLDSATDELRARLEQLLDWEQRAVEAEHGTESSRLNDFLGRRHVADETVSQRVERFLDWDFEDEDAADAFASLVEELDALRRLERFIEQHGHEFRGPERADYPTAQEIRERVERIEAIRQALADGDFGSISPEELEAILGDPDAARSLVWLSGLEQTLRDAGYLREGSAELTPRAVRRLGAQALADVFGGLFKDRPGDHALDTRGAAGPRPDETRRFEFGDPLRLDVVRTLLNTVRRTGAGSPLRLHVEDFEVSELEYATRTTTVLLLDLSWSMSWEGRFAAAKRVALALDHMIRTRFPRDDFFVVGFSTRARELDVRQLPEVVWDAGEPFTNLQAGLQVAERLIARHPSASPQILVITDGQPTAYTQDGELRAELPMGVGSVSAEAVSSTLAEVHRLTRRGVTINTFMLDDAPELVGFVERMTQVNAGRAFFTRPADLGSYVMVDFVSRKRRR